MFHNLIKTREYLRVLGGEGTEHEYLLVLSDDPLVVGDTFFNSDTNYIGMTVERAGSFWICEGLVGEFHLLSLAKKIIAHLPLNNSPILEGVPLLPPLPTESDVMDKRPSGC
jgi:hypothetical protein